MGSVIARRLAHDGFEVAVNGLPGDDDVHAVTASIREHGHAATAFPADVTDPAQVTALAERIGPVDVLVFNATGPQPEAKIMDVGWQEHLDQLDFFVRSPVLLGRALVPGMVERGYGRVIHVDSEVAHNPPPGRSAYVTAKSAQVGLTLSWARELAPHGITVNTVAPGFVPVERHVEVPPEVVSRYLATVPAGRMGTPDDIAHAVSFLADERTGFVTGQRLVVDGGRALGH
nr:3-oxoacyl-[acyl-carrier protein] reductase (EC 1.1.1.100) [Kibdelosporangium sp. MJ126-NF4]